MPNLLQDVLIMLFVFLCQLIKMNMSSLYWYKRSVVTVLFYQHLVQLL